MEPNVDDNALNELYPSVFEFRLLRCWVMVKQGWLLICVMVGWISGGEWALAQQTEPMRWWKGNLHTHSLWSDGDDFPEMIADWYSKQGYHFLAISDHNVLGQGQRWMAYESIVARGGEQIIEKYVARFGNDWVQTQGEPGSKDYKVRLKPFDEYRYLLERGSEFILIPAEEVSDKFEKLPVHLNATNLAEVLPPLGGASVTEVIQNNLRAVLDQEKRLGREMLMHLNHPNFGYGVSYKDLAEAVSEQFFEVFNGHPGVNQLGDAEHPSIERLWDLANTIRLSVLDAHPLYGLGTDDSHEYHGEPGSHPGRGWIMVRSRFLTPEHLIRAMEAGDFYASSGVELREVAFDAEERTLTVSIVPEDGANYRIDFVASLKSKEGDGKEMPEPEAIGKVVGSIEGVEGKYTMTGDELYVRAVITSSLAPKDPVWANQKQQAWTQPVGF